VLPRAARRWIARGSGPVGVFAVRWPVFCVRGQKYGVQSVIVLVGFTSQRREVTLKKPSFFASEPQVEELSGVLEVPLTGFRLQIRGGTIRMIGFILRGEGEKAVPECTLIVHFPKFGFLWCWHHATARLRREPSGLTMQ